ncbi:MAG: polysaccharide deacetylase family protein [Phycisphaerales bacterium]|nr:MAG: polysaccharide deacetylase family protein [Phycisphaerales bacterium]
MGLLVVPGIILLLGGPRLLHWALALGALLIAWVCVRIVKRAGNVQAVVPETRGLGRRVLRYLPGLVMVVIPTVVAARLVRLVRYADAVDNGVLPHTAYVLSFDTEEDWCPQQDAARTGDRHAGGKYLDSYKYITSGIFEKLAEALADRDIPATFYCTPNLAAAHPEVLRKLEALGHEVGVHLHMHNYPAYCVNGEDELACYSPSTQAVVIKQAKEDIEHAVGHPVGSFRSGQWSCDPGVEKACVGAEFSSFSNHRSTFLLPSGIWQVATAKDHDVLMSPRALWRSLRRDDGHSLIPLFSHPMILFDHATDQPRETVLEEFLKQLDDFRRLYPDLRFVTTARATSMLRYQPPDDGVRLLVAAISLLFILGCMATCRLSSRIPALGSRISDGV